MSSTVEVTNTIVGQINDLTLQLGTNLVPLQNMTINNKRNVQPSVLPSSTPITKYFGIGINGFYNIGDSNASAPYIPNGTDADLYTPLPLRAVPVDSDLSDSERANLRMRTRETIDGQDYFLYWLGVLTVSDDTANAIVVDNQNVETTYTFDPSNLSPTPNKNAVDAIASATNRVVVSNTGSLLVTSEQVREVVNVLYNGDMTKARISEVGIYSGEDKVVTGDDGNNGTISYTEAVYVHLSSKKCTTGVDMSNPGSTLTEDLQFENGSTFLI